MALLGTFSLSHSFMRGTTLICFLLFPALTVALVIGQDLQEIPTDLSFSCVGRAYGYYADPSTNCQVFHICLGDGDIKWSFLCPNQTIFNQVRT